MKSETPENTAAPVEAPGKGMCGIVMPMSKSDDYTEEHWIQIRTIIEDAAAEAGFNARIVSTNVNPGILQSNLVTNLYQDEIVVCDVSDRNPNVMLELGIRIAFGKPFIVIKDNSTKFSSDINVVIHELYDRNMLYPEAKSFRNKLSRLITEEAKAAGKTNYKSFLSTFKIPNIRLEDIESSSIEVKELLINLVSSVEELKRQTNSRPDNNTKYVPGAFTLSDDDKAYIREYLNLVPLPQQLGINHHILYMMSGNGDIISSGKISSRAELKIKPFETINEYINTLGLDRSRLFYCA